MKVSDVFDSKYLSAADLGGYEGGKEYTLAIASVEKGEFDNGNKFIIAFQNAKKALVANKTNTQRIAKLYGDETDAWVGKEITLYVDMADFQGRAVEAIRVRPPKRDPGYQLSSGTENGKLKTARVQPAANDLPSDEIPF